MKSTSGILQTERLYINTGDNIDSSFAYSVSSCAGNCNWARTCVSRYAGTAGSGCCAGGTVLVAGLASNPNKHKSASAGSWSGRVVRHTMEPQTNHLSRVASDSLSLMHRTKLLPFSRIAPIFPSNIWYRICLRSSLLCFTSPLSLWLLYQGLTTHLLCKSQLYPLCCNPQYLKIKNPFLWATQQSSRSFTWRIRCLRRNSSWYFL